MATLATAYTNARLLVPGSNSTNQPDATLLPTANGFYRQLALQDMPRVQKYAGGTFGASSLSVAGVRVVTTVGTNIARMHFVRYEGTDATTTDGVPLQYATKPIYELERQTFSGTNGIPRMVYWERVSGGYWNIYLHPATSAVDIYLSVEGEVEPSDLTSGSSTVLLTPLNFTRLESLIAAVIARNLNREEAVIQGILKDESTKAIFGKWLANEEGRGMPLSNEGRLG